MPLDGNGAAQDDAANASENAAAPGSGPPVDLAQSIAAARKAGYDDAAIYGAISQSPKWGQRISAAEAAGHNPSAVGQFLGLNVPSTYGRQEGSTNGRNLPPAARDEGQDRYIKPPVPTQGPVDDFGRPVSEVPTSGPSQPLPRGYVGEGQPYQGGMDFNLPGTERTFTPTDIKVPGQGVVSAYGNAFGQGIVSGTGEAIKGVAEAASAIPATIARSKLALMDNIDAGNPLPPHGLNEYQKYQARLYAQASPEQRQQMRAEVQATVADENKPGPVSKFGQSLVDSSQRNYPVDASQKGFGTAVAGGVGGMIPLFGAAGVGALAGGPAGGVLAASALVGAQAFDATKQEALNKGVAPDVADKAATESALANMGIMALPVGRVIHAMPELGSGILTAVQKMAQSGVEFGSFNALSTFVTNYVRKSTIDPDTPLMQGTGQAAAEGFVTGLLFGVPGVVSSLSPKPNYEGFGVNPDAGENPPQQGLPGPKPNLPPGGAAPEVPPVQPSAQPQPPPVAHPTPTEAAVKPPAAAPTVTSPVSPAVPAAEVPAIQQLEQIASGQPQTGAAPQQGQPEQPAQPQTPPPVSPELHAAVQAHVEALLDPQNPRDAVLVDPQAKGAIPHELPDTVYRSDRPEGTLLTTNPDKMAAFDEAPVISPALLSHIVGNQPPVPVPPAAAPAQAVQQAQQQTAPSSGTPSPAPQSDTTGLAGMGNGMASAMVDNMYDDLWKHVEAGRTVGTAGPDNLLVAAKMVRDKGGLQSRDQFVQFAQTIAPLLQDRTPGWQNRLMNAAMAFAPTAPHEAQPVPQAEQPPAAPKPKRPPPPRPPSPFEPVPDEPMSLINFLRRPTVQFPGTSNETTIPGGINDERGDLKAIVGGSNARPGLFNKNGRSPWDATLAAWEAGYFPEHPPTGERPNDEKILLDRIAEDHRGNRQYSMYDQDAVDAYHHAMTHNAEVDRLAVMYGVDPKGKTREQFFDEIADHMSVEEMAQHVAEHEAAEDEAYRDAERRAQVWAEQNRGKRLTPQDLYGQDQARSLEDLENEHKEIAAAEAREQRPESNEQPGSAAADQTGVPESEEPRGSGAGTERGPEAEGTERPPEPVVEASPEQQALEAADAAFKANEPAYQKVLEAYRAQQVDDATYLAARKIRDDLLAKYDQAYAAVAHGKPAPAPNVHNPEAPNYVTHVTKKGKTLTGVVRHDLTQEQAKAIDPFALKKNGGWFIRKDKLEAVEKPVSKPEGEQKPIEPDAQPKQEQESGKQPQSEIPPEQPQPEQSGAEQPKAEQSEPESELPPNFGANNKTFTADAAAKARARLKEKMSRLNAGFDPEMMLDGLTLAGYYIEGGLRRFADYSKQMLADLGENAKPFLKHFYNSVRDYPGFDNQGMDNPAEVDAELQRMAAPPPTTETYEPPGTRDVYSQVQEWTQKYGPDGAVSRVVAQALEDRLRQPTGDKTIRMVDLQNIADIAYGGKLANNDYARDRLYDAMESGVNRFIQNHPEQFSPTVPLEQAKQTADLLAEVKNWLPPQAGPDLFGAAASEKAPKAQEPTIRNDPAQMVMPGMEPSAVQAQAARNAAGPRGNQKPADEGLFARPEAEQPELAATRSSRWPTGAGDNFKDLLNEAPPLGHQEAADWVWQRGRDTGHEHIAVVDNRTGEIVHAGTNGEPASVGFDYANVIHDKDAYTLHHDHPSSRSLSGQDLAMLAVPGVSHVVAHGHDGNTFVASLAPKYALKRSSDKTEIRANRAALINAHNIAERETERILWDALAKKELDYESADKLFGDMANRLIQAHGLINYSSTRALPQPVRKALVAQMRKLGYDRVSINRSTVAVRPEERIASLPAPVGEQSPPGQPRSQVRPNESAGVSGKGAARSEPSVGRLLEGEGLKPDIKAADPGLLKRAFKGLTQADMRKQLQLAQSSRDNMGVVRKAVDEIHTLFSPTSRGPDAKAMEHIVRKRASMLARSGDQSAHALEQFARAIDRLEPEQQLAITDRAERGQPQPIPELQEAMDALKVEQNKWLRMVQSTGRLQDIENSDEYMGRIYSNYPEWKAEQEAPNQTEAEKRAVAAGISKRPIRGSGNFLKQRSFEYQSDAIEAGLIPVTTNPIKMQILKLREMQKWYHGTRMAQEIKASGLAQWVPGDNEGYASSLGLKKLDDTVFRPKLKGSEHGADFGTIIPGAWYAPAPVADIFNNYVSSGLAGHSVIYDAIRGSGNALNTAQLALSGFHATFVTMDSIMSRMALGLQQLSRGDVLRGAGNIGASLMPGLTPVQTVLRGNALRRAWLDQENATPEMRRLANALNAGGGRINMDQFYRSNASGSFFKSLHDLKNPGGAFREAWHMVRDTPLLAPFKLVGRLMDTLNEPLMGQLVPRMKLGVFSDLATDFLRRKPDATPKEVADFMTKAWDSVDNRLGQLVYDNVFWSKVQKDIAFITTRSVGWNLGTIREIAGAGVDGVEQINRMLRGKAPELTTRMAYTMAMPIVTALVGALLTYLFTGKGPQDMLDYFYPPTGTVTNDVKDRTSIPGYMKDVVAFAHAPLQTLANKQSPLLSTMTEMVQNKDYYGGSIYDPARDSAWVAYPEYLLNQALPFSTRAWMKEQQSGMSMQAQAMSFFGFQPAPSSIVNPDRGERFEERAAAAAYKKRLRENVSGRFQLAPTQ